MSCSKMLKNIFIASNVVVFVSATINQGEYVPLGHADIDATTGLIDHIHFVEVKNVAPTDKARDGTYETITEQRVKFVPEMQNLQEFFASSKYLKIPIWKGRTSNCIWKAAAKWCADKKAKRSGYLQIDLESDQHLVAWAPIGDGSAITQKKTSGELPVQLLFKDLDNLGARMSEVAVDITLKNSFKFVKSGKEEEILHCSFAANDTEPEEDRALARLELAKKAIQKFEEYLQPSVDPPAVAASAAGPSPLASAGRRRSGASATPQGSLSLTDSEASGDIDDGSRDAAEAQQQPTVASTTGVAADEAASLTSTTDVAASDSPPALSTLESPPSHASPRSSPRTTAARPRSGASATPQGSLSPSGFEAFGDSGDGRPDAAEHSTSTASAESIIALEGSASAASTADSTPPPAGHAADTEPNGASAASTADSTPPPAGHAADTEHSQSEQGQPEQELAGGEASLSADDRDVGSIVDTSAQQPQQQAPAASSSPDAVAPVHPSPVPSGQHGFSSNVSDDSHQAASVESVPRPNILNPATAPINTSQPQQEPRTIEIYSQKFDDKLKAIGEISMRRFTYTQIRKDEFNKHAASEVQKHLDGILQVRALSRQAMRDAAARTAAEQQQEDVKEIKENFGEKLRNIKEISVKFNLIKFQMYKPLFEKCVHPLNENTEKENWVDAITDGYCSDVKANILIFIEQCETAHRQKEDEEYDEFTSKAVEKALKYVLDQKKDLPALGRALGEDAAWNVEAQEEFYRYLATIHGGHPKDHALKVLVRESGEKETMEHVDENWVSHPEDCTTREYWADKVTEVFFKKVDRNGIYPEELEDKFGPIKKMYSDAKERFVTEKKMLDAQNERAFTEHKRNARKFAFDHLSEKAGKPEFGDFLETSAIATDELMLNEAKSIMEEYILTEYIPNSLGKGTPAEVIYKINQMIRQDRAPRDFDEEVQPEFAATLAEYEKRNKAPTIKYLFRKAYRDSVARKTTVRMAESAIEILLSRHAAGSEKEMYQRSQLEDLYNRVQNNREDERDAVKDVLKVLIEKQIWDGEIEKLNLGSTLEQETVDDLFGTKTPATADGVKISSFAWKAVMLVNTEFQQQIILKSNDFPVQRPPKTVLRGADRIAKGTKSRFANKHRRQQTQIIPSSTPRFREVKPPSIRPKIISTQHAHVLATPSAHAATGSYFSAPVANTAGGAAAGQRVEHS